jgi:CRP/FNR family transcriptional regulator, cyclic AMP receptor protein
MHTEVQSMMTPPKAYEALSQIGWLGTLPENTRRSLLGASELRHVPANSTLYGLEDPPGGIYGIANGFVDVLAAPGPFQMRLVHVASAGWWVGEAATASRSGRRVELRTRTNVTAAYLEARNLERLAGQDPAIWRHIAALTVRHLDTTMLYAASFASTDLRLRLLTALARIVGPAMELGGSCSLPLGQAELAELTGLSRNSISRLLSKLSDDGCVERHYGSVTVNVNCLKSLADNVSPMNPV